MPTLFKDHILPRVDSVAVLGAGPSMNQYQRDYFQANFDVVIGVNWVYQNFDVDYNVATHFIVVYHAWLTKDCQKIIYSRQTADIGGMANNPKPDGIIFEADEDIWCGTSTIIAAIHLASMISNNVHLYGVDLKQSGGAMYFSGYAQESGNKPSDEHFDDWSKVVERQIKGMAKMTGINLIWERP